MVIESNASSIEIIQSQEEFSGTKIDIIREKTE